MIRIAVDAMGGDYAPQNIIQGAVEAVHVVPEELEITFVGDSQAISDELEKYDSSGLTTRIVHASHVVEMEDRQAPTAIVVLIIWCSSPSWVTFSLAMCWA